MPLLRLPRSAVLLPAVILLGGCSVARIQPNARTAPRHLVVSGALEGPTPRLAADLAYGVGWGDLKLRAGFGGAGMEGLGGELGVGARAYLGPMNLSASVGGVSLGHGVTPVWDLRLTNRSHPRWPLYGGVHAAGTGPDLLLGAVVGAEWWWDDLGFQAELGVTPLVLYRGEWGPPHVKTTDASGAPDQTLVMPLQVGLAVHFDLSSP